MRSVTLNAIKSGINRLRIKGGPSPSTLYDALNCYIDASGAPQSRPGTVIDYELPAGCKGLTAANGELVTFCHEVVSPMPAGVRLHVLSNPEGDPNDPDPIKEIHYAGPFLGDSTGVYLYVVAEFESGDVWHYWLQRAGTWEAEKIYMLGDIVEPTTPNGMAYRAKRLNPAAPKWGPNMEVQVGDVLEPTEFNGYQFEVIDTIGDSPRTGTTEPDWKTGADAVTYEDVDLQDSVADDDSGGGDTPPPGVRQRYGNPGGSRPPSGSTEAR